MGANRSIEYGTDLHAVRIGGSFKRPLCNRFDANNFYARSEKAKFTYTNVPRSAGLYNDDVTIFDTCN